MVKLFIIGNGFDLHHNMKTSYDDYKEYLESYDSRLSKWYEHMFSNFSDKTSLWKDIEDNSYFSYQEYMAQFELYNDANYNDEEKFTYAISISENDVYNSNQFYKIQFKNWVNSIELTQPMEDIKKIISKEDYFITFNYTNTLEVLYQIPDNHILHMHGKIGEELIFGSAFNNQYEVYEYIDRIYKDRGPRNFIDRICSNLKELTYNLTKENDLYLVKIGYLSLPKIDEIVIYGHHISDDFMDVKYYNKYLLPNYKELKWTFYYFDEETQIDIKKFINKFKLKNIKLIKI